MKQLRNPPSAQAPHSRRAAASPSAAQPLAKIADATSPRQLKQQERISQLRNADSSTAHALPAALREGVESLSGQDLSDVRVHRNSSEPAQLNALAYAQGRDIHLAPGQERHLPHEAWHVVQQRQGRVKATAQLAGVALNDQPHLEREADAMGQRAESLGNRRTPGATESAPAQLCLAGGSAPVQRVITTADPHTDTTAWLLPDYRLWLQGRPIGTASLALPVAPPQPSDFTPMALHELGLLHTAPPPAHAFATLDLLHQQLVTSTDAMVQGLLAAGVLPADLDIAAAMYGRLEGHEGEEAILHKLEWRDAHHRQYQQQGVNEHLASTSGLVYGPWRSGGQPDDGTGANAENVHTMPLNVAWLLACCHHRVSFRLYVPITERALYRKNDAGLVVGAGGQQRKLSALGRELMALLVTGLYTAGPPERDDRAPQGFETTLVLSPTPAAATATAPQLSVANNLTLDHVRQALELAGLPMAADEAGVEATATAARTLPDLENTVRQRYGAHRRAPAGAYALNSLRQAEAQIVRVTRESIPAMRTRVLGGAHLSMPVTFDCQYATQPGQEILVVGDQPLLGDWNPANAAPLQYAGPGAWQGTVTLPDVLAKQTLSYKYLLAQQGRRDWEPGNNHQRELPDMGAPATPVYTDNWGQG